MTGPTDAGDPHGVRPFAWWPWVLGAVAVVCWSAYFLLALSAATPDFVPSMLRLPAREGGETVLAQRGQFGDAFGAFNALVSTLALVGLFFTIRSQQQQLATQVSIGRANDLLVRQQQFQEQFYRAVDAYRELLAEITAHGADGAVHRARAALNHLWREGVIARIAGHDVPLLDEASRAQRDAQQHETLGAWNTNDRAALAIDRLLQALSAEPDDREATYRAIGEAWAAMVMANRFQLDALFRAWYTVYRVLATAPAYQLDPPTVRLYAAGFRAQLSWVELAFLLVNQSALPGCPSYPRASHMSNLHATFDNLDVSHDVVLSVLRQRAALAQPYAGVEQARLTDRAFHSAGEDAAAGGGASRAAAFARKP